MPLPVLRLPQLVRTLLGADEVSTAEAAGAAADADTLMSQDLAPR